MGRVYPGSARGPPARHPLPGGGKARRADALDSPARRPAALGSRAERAQHRRPPARGVSAGRGACRGGRDAAGRPEPALDRPPDGTDDVVVGPIELDARPLGEARLEVAVAETPGGAALPCRITVGEGGWAPMVALSGQRLAVRPGVAYTGDGRARIALPSGDYTVYASRGSSTGSRAPASRSRGVKAARSPWSSGARSRRRAWPTATPTSTR